MNLQLLISRQTSKFGPVSTWTVSALIGTWNVEGRGFRESDWPEGCESLSCLRLFAVRLATLYLPRPAAVSRRTLRVELDFIQFFLLGVGLGMVGPNGLPATLRAIKEAVMVNHGYPHNFGITGSIRARSRESSSCCISASSVRLPAIEWKHYSFSDTGSDSFFGDFLSSREINSRPEAGTPTLPSRTICLALRARP